jgi:DnaK suppressor protein
MNSVKPGIEALRGRPRPDKFRRDRSECKFLKTKKKVQMTKTSAREEKRLMETYRKMLLDKKEQVMAGLGMKFDTIAKMGRVAEEDQAQLSHDEFVSLRLNSLDYVQLRLITEALDRISSGDYGVCLGCDTPIPAKRLQAVPWARYCVICQDQVGSDRDSEPADLRPRPN